MVHPESFGPDETILTVTVKGGLDGQVLFGTLILESETENVKVDLTARWAMPPEVIDEAPVIIPPPVRSPTQSRPRPRRQPIRRIRVTCPDCDHQFSVREAGEVQCPACEWDFEVDEDGDVVDGVPIEVTCPACDQAFKVREAGEVQCPACEWDFEVDEEWRCGGRRTHLDDMPKLCAGALRTPSPARCNVRPVSGTLK